MALTDVQIRQTKPRDKEYKLTDAGGLYLLVRPSGSKHWKLKLRVHGREQKLSFGPYPEIGLKEARALRDEAKLEMHRGGDPVQRRRNEKLAAQLRAGSRFEDVAEEFIAKREAEGLANSTIAKARWFLEILRARIGKRPIAEISSLEVLDALRRIEAKGHRESARRARSFASRVFQYAVITGRCASDPAAPLRGALVAPVAKSYAAIIMPSDKPPQPANRSAKLYFPIEREVPILASSDQQLSGYIKL